MITKSGTNQVKGGVFDYYQTPMFKARNPFALARPTGVSHLHGGNVGKTAQVGREVSIFDRHGIADIRVSALTGALAAV